jgi:hypothetical protein
MLDKLLFLTIIFSLSACGGGSGGDDNNSSNYRDARQVGSASSSADYIFTDYVNGGIYGSADYQNSDFIKMKVERAGKLQIEITPDDYSLDIDCGLTSSVGPSDEFYANNFIYDDNGFEIIENSSLSSCNLSADFSDDREFYLFIDIADGQVASGSYTVTYRFTPEYIDDGSDGSDYTFTDYDSGGIYGSANYQNSDFIKMKVEGAGKLRIVITPDDYSLDIDCGLTSSVGPSTFYENNFIYDDNGVEISDNSGSSTCYLTADFSDDREFYLFIDIADGPVTSGSYTATYIFTPTPEYIADSYDAIASDGCHEGTTSNVELEPNDSDAQSVAFGQSITGQISSVSDVDMYCLNAPGPGKITLSMSSDESPFSGWILELRDSDGFVLSSSTCDYYADCDEGITVPVGISGAGDYMLVVSSESPYTKPDGLYTVSASFSE